ncbi:MAG: methyltransferase domain-containing protein [Longimicrobiales bacterium]|nr:methyltransferase domain-containing protein [Longimicrobiales bacterium]
MGLEFVRKTYERWASEDPMYTVITRRGKSGGRWDPEEFFQHGRNEIREVVAYLDDLGIDIRGSRALDFGCGVGRLTQALAEYADEVVGVDIAAPMIEQARSYNRHGDRVRYRVNTDPDLKLFDDAVFDFVYSNITLQHVPPRYGREYIREFFRVVRPGGCVLFQMRSGPRIEPGSLRALLYRLNREHLRHLFQRLRGRPPYEIHFIAREQVEELIADAGGELIDVKVLDENRRRNFLYCSVRSDGSEEA